MAGCPGPARACRPGFPLLIVAVLICASNAAAEDAARAPSPKAAAPAKGSGASAAAPAQGAGGLVACLKAIPGPLEFLLPGAPNYELLSNGLRPTDVFTPAAVAWPSSYAQVQAAVRCAAANGARPVPRSGGYSFENLCSANGALVIDLTNMSLVTTDVGGMTATVQAGARMGNVYADIFEAGRRQGGRNLTCLGGTSPMVGFGGLLAAGGYGAFTRKHGLLSDSVVAAKVVDAQGRLLTVDATSHPDLFFAIRGGGGGTYGIVVEATVKLFEAPVVTVARIKFEGVDQAVAVWDRFQRWGPVAPEDLSLKFNLKPGKTDINIQYLGRKVALDRLLKEQSGLLLPGAIYEAVECDIQGSRGWTPETSIVPNGNGGWKTRSHWLMSPACWPDTRVPQRVRPGGPLAYSREGAQYRSAFFKDPIPKEGLERLKQVFASPSAATRSWRQILCRVHGPGLRKPAAAGDAGGAFGHRDQNMICEYGVSFQMGRAIPEVPDAIRGPAWEFFQQAREAVGRYASGAEYNGWLNRFDAPRAQSYFGPNYERLRAVKKAYDPGNVFTNAHAVPPPGQR